MRDRLLLKIGLFCPLWILLYAQKVSPTILYEKFIFCSNNRQADVVNAHYFWHALAQPLP